MGQMPTLQEHEATGRNAVLYGQLQLMRDELGFSRSAMADLLSISPVTYIRCEGDPSYSGAMWRSTAERLGRFMWLAERQLDLLEDEGIHLGDLMPLSEVATVSGMPQEVLMKWHREGVIATEDLGILGLWMYREDLHLVGEVRTER